MRWQSRRFPNGEAVPFTQRLMMALLELRRVCRDPGDMVAVRMQNDIKLPADQRRNYKHAIDGMIRVAKEEGFAKLFKWCQLGNYESGFLMTIGQLCFYDQIKQTLLETPYFQDNLVTHSTSSLGLELTATTMTHLDVLKTRSMNAKPGEFKSSMDLVRFYSKEWPNGFLQRVIFQHLPD